jgi:hypothetical protein
MGMRVLIAGLLGGIVFFVWGALSHMVLQIGDVGFHYGTPYRATLAALKQEAPQGGAIMMPTVGRANMMDDAAQKQLAAESAGQGYAFIVYAPGGNPASVDMGPVLGKQFATDFLSALVAAWLLSLGVFGFGKRVAMAAGLGLFAWLVVAVPYWNWYLFPLDYTLGLLAKYLVGWALAGTAMAWWLGRGGR